MDVDMQKILNSMGKITEYANQKMMINEEDEIVAFIGATKSGKSTLINCLLRNKLRVKENEAEGDFTLEQIDENSEPKIGSGAESETWIPCNFGVVPGTPWPMWDFPGFEDNKGIEREIAHAINLQKVLKRVKGVRFVMCVPFPVIRDDNPMPFFKQLNALQSYSENVSNSLCLVSTKAERGNFKMLLEKLSEAEMSDLSDGYSNILSNAQKILRVVLQNESFFDFRAPRGFEDGEEYEMKDKNKLAESLKNTCTISVNSRISVSDGAKLFIKNMHVTLYASFMMLAANYSTELENYKNREIAEASRMQGTDKISHCAQLVQRLENISQCPDVKTILTDLDSLLPERHAEVIIQLINTVDSLRELENDDDNLIYVELLKESIQKDVLDIIIKINTFSKRAEKENERLIKRRDEKARAIRAKEENNRKTLGAKVYDFVNNHKEIIASTSINIAINLVPWGNAVRSVGLSTGLIAAELTFMQKVFRMLTWR